MGTVKVSIEKLGHVFTYYYSCRYCLVKRFSNAWCMYRLSEVEIWIPRNDCGVTKAILEKIREFLRAGRDVSVVTLNSFLNGSKSHLEFIRLSYK